MRDIHSVVFLHAEREWMSKRVLDLFELSRKTRATQQWSRYASNWPIALNALRQLWEAGKVSELKSPFWEPAHKPANRLYR